MSEKKSFNGGVKSKVDFAVFTDANISRQEISEWLVRDIKNTYFTLSEVLNSKECIEALTDVFYKRYCDMHAAKAAQPELNLDQNG